MMKDEFLEELKSISIFKECDEGALRELLASPYRRHEFGAGKLISRAGEPCRSLMLLTNGSADARMMSDEGREVLVDHLKAPQILAPAFLFASENAMPVEVTAQTNCTMWYINREAFFSFMIAQPQVLRAFLQEVSNRGRFLSGKMRSFAVKGLRNRILEYLGHHGSIASVAKTAEQLGVTRPSLSRLLSEMTAEGVIEKIGKGYKKSDNK